jgi:hypothetical protein
VVQVINYRTCRIEVNNFYECRLFYDVYKKVQQFTKDDLPAGINLQLPATIYVQ